jgi:hypothetical protein
MYLVLLVCTCVHVDYKRVGSYAILLYNTFTEPVMSSALTVHPVDSFIPLLPSCLGTLQLFQVLRRDPHDSTGTQDIRVALTLL